MAKKKEKRYVSDNAQLMAEWDWEKNDEQGIYPDRITCGSGIKAGWKCDKGHKWVAQISSRFHGVGCPYCSNRKVLCGYNDLTTTHPQVASEWHPTKNGAITPSTVTFGSGKKVWWQCRNGHDWEATINNRVKGRGCPICSSRRRTSFPEQAIFYYVKQVFPDAINSYRNLFEKSSMELDIYIPQLKVGIEYDGKAFHRSDKNRIRDAKKYSLCKEKGVILIRITDRTETELITNCDYKIVIPEANEQHLNNAIAHLLFKLQRPLEVNIRNDRLKILEYLSNADHSLQDVFPEIAAEWHAEKNAQLTPSMFHPGSNEKVWWQCSECGYEWQTKIIERTGKDKTGCPKCSRKKGAKKFSDYVLSKQGSVAEKAPHLLTEWDYEKNECLPDELSSTSGKRVWWKCPKCGYNWQAPIIHRTSRNHQCPCCSNQVVVTGVNDLSTTHPHLASEWNPTRNHIMSTEVQYGTNKKYWWTCGVCGYEWEASPSNRSKKGSGCPCCSGRVPMKGKNDFETLYPKIASEWNYEQNAQPPSAFLPNSHTSVWWKCQTCTYEWEATIQSRIRGAGCPQCARATHKKR